MVGGRQYVALCTIERAKKGAAFFAAGVRGFTLPELLSVLMILALLMTLAVPFGRGLVQDTRLGISAGDLLDALQLARSEAVLRGHTVSVCPSSISESGVPACGDDYKHGWIVFSNPARDSVVDVTEDQIIQVFPPLPKGFNVVNRSATRSVSSQLNYGADGSSHRNLTMQLCPPDTDRRSISIILNIVGRARLERNFGTCRGAVS
jgi:type IV fimbrial biogenesis protein FimT